MSDWAVVFLGMIAVASLATAIVQVGVLLSATRLARRAEHLMDRVEREVGPVLDHLNAIGRDAAHAASLAAAQVDRADRVFGGLATRLDETLNAIQSSINKPAREVAAIAVGIQTALGFLREFRRRRSRSRADDEDALFI